jgi:hypothetical protein
MATAERKAVIGNGVNITTTDTKVIITLDITKDFGPSKGTGKTIIVASTLGNVRLSNGVTLGLNCYRPKV